MIKILHSADIHLDSPLKSLALRDPELRDRVEAATRSAFRRLIQVALDERVAALLIAGDLFDGAARSAKTAAFLVTEFDRLRDAGIPIFYIKGNHDAENPITGEVALPENVHVFDGRGGKVQLPGQDIWVHGVSFAGKHAPESLLGKFPAPVPDALNIAMLHTSLSGAAGHDPYAPCSVAELKAMGFDYWALGHVHKRAVHAEAPWIVMPGMPQGRDMGEDGPKSATMLRIEERRITLSEVPTAGVIFARQELDISEVETEDALRRRLRETLNALAPVAQAETLLLRLTLSGRTPLAWAILRDRTVWEETLRVLAQDTGAIWIEKLEMDLHEAGSGAASVAASDELADLMAQIACEDGFAAWRDAEVAALLADLPATRRAALLPDEDTAQRLAETLADRGATQMLARMIGAAS